MIIDMAGGSHRFADRVAKLLEHVEYRCAVSSTDREAVYRLRYEVYLRQNLLNPRLEGMLYDERYDNSSSAFTIMTIVEGQLASTIRVHVVTSESPTSPALDVFPDIISPLLQAGRTILDPTRLAASAEMSKRYPELPYFALRPAWMAAEHFDGDFIVVSSSVGHEAFYRRVIGYERWSGLRSYPQVTAKVICMGLDFATSKSRVETRYPSFRSTRREREALFGGTALSQTAATPHPSRRFVGETAMAGITAA